MAPIVPGSTPLTARTRELSQVVEAAARAFSSPGARVALVAGDAGTGKSRLLHEASEALAARFGALPLSGFAMPAEGQPAYFALGRAVRRLARIEGIEGRLSPDVAALLAASGLWPGSAPQASTSQPLAGSAIGVLEALSTAIDVAADQQPLVFLLDDMQWATREDWDAIAYAARVVEGPVAFIVGARPTIDTPGAPPASALQELTRNRLLVRIGLHNLEQDAANEFTAAVLGATPGESLSTLLWQAVGGNPFFIEELCGQLSAANCLVKSADRVEIDPAAPAFPRAASGVVLQRLAELTAPARDMLAVAAVFGRRGSLGLLARLLSQAPENLRQLIDEATNANLVAPLEGEEWLFRHDLVREAVLFAVPDARAIHRTIASVLEADPGSHPRAVAEHWAAAGDPERAATAAIGAARAALANHAPHEALDVARLAHAQAMTPGVHEPRLALESLAAMGDAGLEAGELQVAAEAYAALEELAARESATHFVGRGRVGLGTTAWRRERPDEAITHLHAGIAALALVDGAEADLAGARIALASIYGLTRADYAAANREGQQAVELARAIGDDRLESEALLGLANSRARELGPEAARGDLELALEHALASSHAQVAAEAAAALSNNYYWTGELRRARHFGETRLEVSAQSSDIFGLRHARSWLALLAASAGNWQEALDLLGQDEAWLQRVQAPEPLAFAHIVRAFVHLRTGEFEQSWEDCTGAIAMLRPLGDGTLLWYGGLWALIAVASGRLAEGQQLAEEQFSRLATVDESALPARSARCALGIVCALLGLEREAAELERALRPYATDYHWWPMRLTLAELALFRGDQTSATTEVDIALGEARREGRLADVAMLLDARARSLLANPRAAKAASEESREIASRIGLAFLDRRLPRAATPAGLTPREVEVLRFLAEGLSNREIAARLVLSERTVVNHVSHIFDKLAVESRSAAAAWAIRAGLA